LNEVEKVLGIDNMSEEGWQQKSCMQKNNYMMILSPLIIIIPHAIATVVLK
jgi:hypothetical protein